MAHLGSDQPPRAGQGQAGSNDQARIPRAAKGGVNNRLLSSGIGSWVPVVSHRLAGARPRGEVESHRGLAVRQPQTRAVEVWMHAKSRGVAQLRQSSGRLSAHRDVHTTTKPTNRRLSRTSAMTAIVSRARSSFMALMAPRMFKPCANSRRAEAGCMAHPLIIPAR